MRFETREIAIILVFSAIRAVTVVDFLADDAKDAKRVMDSFKPIINRKENTKFMKKLVQ